MGANNRFFWGILSVIIISIFFSCKEKDSNRYETSYKIFNHKQHDWKSKSITQFIGDINYTATEVPLQYYLLKNNPDAHQKVDSLYQLNKRERVLQIEFQHADQSDLLKQEYTHRSYEDAVKYMAFTINKDFSVVTSSNDTIACSGVNFERNFKIAPFKRVLLYFNDINPEDHIKLIYQDQLFGNGIIKFSFNETPLIL